jgi:hypothetical protein
MLFEGTIIGRRKDLGLDRTTKIRDLFRPLINQQTVENCLGRASSYTVTQIFQECGLPRPRRGQDQSPLAKPDRAE